MNRHQPSALAALGLLVLFISGLGGCGLASGVGDAQKRAEAFLDDRIANGGTGDDAYYGEAFWKATDREKWAKLQAFIERSLGKVERYSLKTWNVQTKAMTGQLSGTFVTLVYTITYEKGTGEEVLTLHKGIGGDTFHLLGHRFNSEIFKNLMESAIDEAVEKESPPAEKALP